MGWHTDQASKAKLSMFSNIAKQSCSCGIRLMFLNCDTLRAGVVGSSIWRIVHVWDDGLCTFSKKSSAELDIVHKCRHALPGVMLLQ
mmetsp:Transcript_41391/g.123605  ORF Transcript_41391/g.123605 Transcript_41391/m.123605 type:complete len:87 (+) Transcript_41391:5094-5354(+)